MDFFLKRKIFFSLSLFLLVAVAQSAFAKSEVRFSKFNIHTQAKNAKTSIASYANYTRPGAGHIIIPAGTKINIIKKSRKNFIFTYGEKNREVIFAFHEPRMGMTVDEYLEKITSTEPVSLNGLSNLDRKGVSEGKALQGMSRQGVMVALGYPAAHRTPSLDSQSWTYWTNRFGTIVVEFDGQGKVVNVRD